MDNKPKLTIMFFRTEMGREPVKDWFFELKKKNPLDVKAIGADIKTVQFQWPIGYPLVEKIDKDL